MAPCAPSSEGSAPARSSQGPLFRGVPSFDWNRVPRDRPTTLAQLAQSATTPVVVRGAAASWPACADKKCSWSFERLAELAECDGRLEAPLQNGLIEQGATQPKRFADAGQYLRELAAEEADISRCSVSGTGLLPEDSPEAAALHRGEAVPLRWSWLAGRKPNRLYLGHWDFFKFFPAMRAEAPGPREQWPRQHWVFDFVWFGPPHTVTGLHYDVPDNWFTQIRGVKEMILFPQDQAPFLPLSDKYDPGAYLCAVDITAVAEMPPEQRRLFEQARGWYVRLGPGDALFVPKRTFHAVVSLTPSISISAFGHSRRDLITGGIPLEVRDWLHRVGLWRWGACSCHAEGTPRPLAGPAAVAGVGAACAASLAYLLVSRWRGQR